MTNTYQQERIQERVYEGFDYTDPTFIRGLFEQSEEHLHLPKDKRALCLINAPVLTLEELGVVLDSNTDEDYKDAVLRAYSSSSSPLPSTFPVVIGGQEYCRTPGVIQSHQVEVSIKDGDMIVELPEVEVWQDVKPFVARIRNASEKRLRLELFVCLCYVYRFGMDDKEVLTEAINRGMDYKVIKGVAISAGKKWMNTPTLDTQYMVEWFKKAVKECNSWTQVDILTHVYIEAVTYNNSQPAISKKRISEKVGCDPVVIRRLFKRLEKAGVMVEGPESTKEYDYKAGMPLSNPRILNLNPEKEPGRWEGMNLKPAPNRSKEHKAEKAKRKTQVLASNGYWFDNAAKSLDDYVAMTQVGAEAIANTSEDLVFSNESEFQGVPEVPEVNSDQRESSIEGGNSTSEEPEWLVRMNEGLEELQPNW